MHMVHLTIEFYGLSPEKALVQTYSQRRIQCLQCSVAFAVAGLYEEETVLDRHCNAEVAGMKKSFLT